MEAGLLILLNIISEPNQQETTNTYLESETVGEDCIDVSTKQATVLALLFFDSQRSRGHINRGVNLKL